MNSLDKLSSVYSPEAPTAFENQLILQWYPKRILSCIDDSKAKSLLELGIGHGHTTKLFNSYFAKHTVVEGSGSVIDMFKRDSPENNACIVNAFFEEYETLEKFDVIIMGFVLEHVDDPGLIVNKFKKYLKEDGKIFIAVPNAKSLNRRLGIVLNKIDDIYGLNENDLKLGHKRNFCIDTLRDLLHQSGLQATHVEGIYLKPFPLGYMQLMPEFLENTAALCEVGVEFPDLCVALLVEARV